MSDGAINTVTEACSQCGESTPHAARIEIRVESVKETNASYSREPYRVSECIVCGEEQTQRMNNA